MNTKLIILLTILLLLLHSSYAQSGKNEYSVTGSGSFDSTELIGSTPDARSLELNLQYSRIFKPGNNIAVRYTAEVTPFKRLSFPYWEWRGNSLTKIRRSRKGWGMAPLGIQVNFNRRKTVQPFVTASGGFLAFSKPLPDEYGAKFNFTADVGGGLQFLIKNRRAVSVGYKYQHISNGYRAENNPGYDLNIFYVRYSLFR